MSVFFRVVLGLLGLSGLLCPEVQLQAQAGEKFDFDIDKAVNQYRILQQAVKDNPTSAAAHINLGLAYLALVKQDPEDPTLAEAHYMIGLVAIREGRLDEAINSLKTALKLQPELAGAHYFLATIYEARSQFDQAEKEYQLTIEIQPSFAEAYERLERLKAVQQAKPGKK